jgi:hypothetical protein
MLHLEATSDSCGHFLNPYINLHLEDKFDFFPIELITLTCQIIDYEKAHHEWFEGVRFF